MSQLRERSQPFIVEVKGREVIGRWTQSLDK